MSNSDLEKSKERFLELPNTKKGSLRDIRIPGKEQGTPGGKANKKSLFPNRNNRTAALAKVPQAVVKITGYSKQSHQQVKTHITYITRNGKLPLNAKMVRFWKARKRHMS